MSAQTAGLELVSQKRSKTQRSPPLRKRFQPPPGKTACTTKPETERAPAFLSVSAHSYSVPPVWSGQEGSGGGVAA